ncbi:MAG: VWA domain-containing protein [Armatimonadota bacterium]|nr:VWA domain-containing protein [Armatimonadota bacterium]MDR5676206.1 VWA domain-containing protein [Armatimonadota bacterium]MDR5689157.1 VWA domain-containing protein [Armatimonadota bacterium]MDR7388871.1 VWA domain-containing protein [Armatimonadota bacterium]MDR7392070.1 VWA domain-containing protein [Armatimonadota bacterium]
MRPDFGSLTEHVVEFSRRLRARGVLCGPAETADALRALRAVNVLDREAFRLALRTTLPHRREDLGVFDALFVAYWQTGLAQRSEGQEDRPEPQAVAEAASLGTPSLRRWAEEATEGEQELPGYSPVEVLSRKDFSSFREDELDVIARLVVAIARRIATRWSRRRRRARRSHLLDMRRTLRLHLRWGGEFPGLAFQRRKVRKHRVVLLCDVSGSMDVYSRFLIQFVYALQDALGRVESFVFSTSLTRVTEELRTRSLRAALDRLSQRVPNWSGGTKIGSSLRQFLDRYGGLLDRHTVVLIVSDGWDTGEVEVLRRAMQEIRSRAARVIWLNPLLGSPGYQPLTRGMQAALPYVHVFASAHNADSLRELERVLARGRVGRPRR